MKKKNPKKKPPDTKHVPCQGDLYHVTSSFAIGRSARKKKEDGDAGGGEAASKHVLDMPLHVVRDTAAFTFLMPPLLNKGCIYRGFIHSYPAVPETGKPVHPDSAFYFLRRERTCLVQTTRPALNEDPEHDKRIVAPSGNFVEKNIFAAICPRFFVHIARNRVVLGDEFADALPAKLRGMAGLDFSVYRDTKYRDQAVIRRKCNGNRMGHYHVVPPAEQKSVGYFLHLEKISDDLPCRLILSFGVGGTGTLLWNYMVAQQHPKWLERPVFAMAQMDLPTEKWVLSPQVADGLKHDVVFEQYL